MILDAQNNQEHELYIKALRSLDKNNAVSEYRKVPNTPEEVEFMRETNHASTKSMFGLNISEERYKKIFTNQDVLRAMESIPETNELVTSEFINTFIDDMFGETQN